MRANATRKALAMAGAGVVLSGLLLAGCGKANVAVQTDPHSIDGVMQSLVEHAGLLTDATKRQDFKYVHDYAYHMKNLAQALYSKLDDQQKEKSKSQFEEFLEVVDQLDASSGRRHEQATLAGTQRLLEILKELDAQLRPGKKTVMEIPTQRKREA